MKANNEVSRRLAYATRHDINPPLPPLLEAALVRALRPVAILQVVRTNPEYPAAHGLSMPVLILEVRRDR